MYVQMSNALTGAPLENETKKNLQNHKNKETEQTQTKPKKGSLFDL